MSLPFNDSKAVIYYTDPSASMKLTNLLSGLFRALPPDQRIVILCVGTDRSTGDSLGPLTGSLLGKYRSPWFDLYGTLEKPVHAMNLDDTLERLFLHSDNPYVIGIDACLGSVGSIGTVQIVDGPLRPGAGVNKSLTPVGNIHISGVVNVGGLLGYHVLQNTRLHLVMSMSSLIARSLYVAISIKASEDREAAP